MEFLQLNYFQTVAKLEHMTQAAKQLHVSQPALSKIISRLEKELGVQLFDRKKHSIRLNENGRAFLKRVERILHEAKQGTKEVQDLNGLKERSVSVSMALPHILPFFFSDYLKKYPDGHIKHFTASANEMAHQLEQGFVDLCISTSPIEGEGIKWMPLMEEDIYLSVPLSHRLSERKEIMLSEAAGEMFINRNKDTTFVS